ncbi:MAG TPA: hypothetical protein DDW67_04350 [Elusimicrobia bacterium]|nr:hypothetical protein [Elusimicrobiota bacterium]
MIAGIFASRTRSFFCAAVLLSLIAALDYAVGIEIGVSAFYLIPVSISAWGLGLIPALGFAAASAALWLVNDYLLGAQYYSHPGIAYWNAGIRLIFFVSVAVTLHKLRSAMEKQERLAAVNSEMVSLVSHELNNYLVSAQLAVSLLADMTEGRRDEETSRYYLILEQAHRNIARTVKTFLNKARLETGRFKLEKKETEFRKLVFESLEHLSYLAKDKEIELRTDFPEKVVPIECDPDIIALVVANLINNAIKYTPSGGEIVISLKRSSAGLAEFSVKDSGIGISREDLESIFTGFYRTEQGRRTAAGTGLGLKISRDFVEAHGSRLEAESEPGRGTRFFFSLPVSGYRT